MARITQEDCLPQVQNRFELVLKAAQRARDLELDEVDPVISADNDKPTVVALREIASGIDYNAARDAAATEEGVEASEVLDIDQQLKEQLSSETMVDTELLAALNSIDDDLELGADASATDAEDEDNTNNSSDEE